MLTAATTPTTTPAATPATFVEPPDDESVGCEVEEASAGLVTTMVVPGPVLVTTVGGLVGDVLVLVGEVLDVVDDEDDDESSPLPPYDGTLDCSPVNQIE